MKARFIGRFVVALSTVIVALAVSHGGAHAGVANAQVSSVSLCTVGGSRGGG